MEYPDIAALYQKLKLAATTQNPDGSPLYTLPVIYDPNTNETISDSTAIAQYLDKTYPYTPALFHQGTRAFHASFAEMARWFYASLYNVVCYAVWTRLTERSQIYYRTTREAHLGKKLEELRTDEDWKEAERACDIVDKWLRANLEDGEGRDELMMGKQICFAEIILVSGLLCAKTALGPQSDEWARIMSWNDGKWKRIMGRFAQYAVVDI